MKKMGEQKDDGKLHFTSLTKWFQTTTFYIYKKGSFYAIRFLFNQLFVNDHHTELQTITHYFLTLKYRNIIHKIWWKKKEKKYMRIFLEH